MSSVMMIDCHYCPAENTPFFYNGHHHARDGTPWATYICPRCHSAVVAHIHGNVIFGSSAAMGEIRDRFTVEHFPRRPPPDVPGGLPVDIGRVFIRANDALWRKDTDAAIILIRKALETALRDKFSEDQGSLYTRINTLRNKHLITPALADWAHVIREEGNTGAHDPTEPDLDQTRESFEFLRVFLLYVYTLPKMIEERRAKP